MFFLRTKEKIEVVGSERLPQDHPESKGRKKLELNPAVSPSRAKPFWQHLNSAPRSGGVALFEAGVGRDPWILKAQSGGGFTGREVVWCLNAHSQKKHATNGKWLEKQAPFCGWWGRFTCTHLLLDVSLLSDLLQVHGSTYLVLNL